MNDLTQYNSVKSALQPGCKIFYWGTNLLSELIELAQGSPQAPSHVQVVERIEPDGTVWIAESTIQNGVSGVQRHQLAGDIAYAKGRVGAAILSTESNARADWSKLTPYIDSCIGKVAYDVLGLVKFLEPEALREGQINDKNMVCSAFAASVDEALGILFGVPYSQVSQIGRAHV